MPNERLAPEHLSRRSRRRAQSAARGVSAASALVLGAIHEAAAADHDLRGYPLPDAGASDSTTGAPEAGSGVALLIDDILRFPARRRAWPCTPFEQADFADPAAGAAIASTTGHAARRWRRGARRGNRRAGGDARPPARRRARHARCRWARPRRFGWRACRAGALSISGSSTCRCNAWTRSLMQLLGELGQTRRGSTSRRCDTSRATSTLRRRARGRCFVVDWKSNHPGDCPEDYGAAPMVSGDGRAGLPPQALIYAVASTACSALRPGRLRPGDALRRRALSSCAAYAPFGHNR